MEKKKLCCRVYPVVLLVLSTVISLAIWFFEEGKNSFAFLIDKNEIFNFLGTILFVALIPIGIFYWLNDSEKYQTSARALSLLGFIPALLFLVFVIIR